MKTIGYGPATVKNEVCLGTATKGRESNSIIESVINALKIHSPVAYIWQYIESKNIKSRGRSILENKVLN